MITVNGNKVSWENGMTVSSLLERLNYVFPMVVVKLNSSVIRREDFSNTYIPDGAKVDVIHLISGG